MPCKSKKKMKQCPICQKEFELFSKFHPNQRYCKRKCRNIAISRRYREKHPERIKSYSKGYHNINKKQEKEYRQKPEVKERMNISAKKWRKIHPERAKEIGRNYYWRNPEKQIQESKDHRNTPEGREKYRHYARRYYAKRKRSLYGYPVQDKPKLSYKDKIEIRKRDKKCVYCGSTEKLTEDHIIPVKKGGLDIKENVVIACSKCNCSRQDKDIFEWCKFKGYKIPAIIKELLK